jgi:hypothetical protein
MSWLNILDILVGALYSPSLTRNIVSGSILLEPVQISKIAVLTNYKDFISETLMKWKWKPMKQFDFISIFLSLIFEIEKIINKERWNYVVIIWGKCIDMDKEAWNIVGITQSSGAMMLWRRRLRRQKEEKNSRCRCQVESFLFFVFLLSKILIVEFKSQPLKYLSATWQTSIMKTEENRV